MIIAHPRSTRRQGSGVTARACVYARIKVFTATTFVILAAGLLVTAPALAAPGDLDASFSEDGRQITDFGAWDRGEGVAIQVDGKIVVAGRTVDGGGTTQDFALARYNADGAFDASFSGDGKQTTDFGANDVGAAAAIQADGKIVVAGSARHGAGYDDFAVARYNTDGSPDTSFSGDGRLTTDLGGGDDGSAVAIQADGKLVVAGRSGDDFALARYRVDGTLDTSFSGDGTVTTDLGGWDPGQAVAIQADAKVVVVGTSDVAPTADGDDPSADFALVRYNADGSLDTSLSGDGRQTTDFSGGFDGGEDVAIEADGSIVVAGHAGEGPEDPFGGYVPNDFAVARYNADGALDASFSGDGKQTTDFGGDEFGFAVVVQADGSIVTVGHAAGDFALAGYDVNGSLDTGFSDDGKLTTDFGGGDEAFDGVLQADGKVVAGGTTSGAGGLTDFALARYDGDSAVSSPPPDTTPPPEPLAAPPAGTYQGQQSVALSSETGASIHYTIDGSDPTSADRRFDPASPIQVTESQEVRAIAIDQTGNRSWVASHAYTIVPDYRIAVLGTVGLVSYWRLGETSGMTAADAREANNGGYRNGVLLGRPSALLHDANASAGFDGSNDYVSVADHASLDTGDRFTLEAWVKRSSSSSSTKTVLSKGSGSWRLSFVNDVLTLTKASSGTIAKAGVSTTDDRFHHLVATKSGATVRLYIDGLERTGTVTNRTIANTSTALNIGRYTSGSEYFPGLIDEAAIYNVALSEAEVQQHFKASGR
jgi:uncharacterized delta-60 repeat protein